MKNSFSILDWLLQSKGISGLFKRIGVVTLCLIVGFVYFIGMGTIVRTYILGRTSDYVLITTSAFSNVSYFLLPIAALVCIIAAFVMKRYKVIYVVIALLSVLICYYSMNKYTVVTEDKIVVHNLFESLEEEYEFSDVERVLVGIKTGKYKSVYYEVVFNDGSVKNLVDNFVFDNNIDILNEVDEIFRKHNVEKYADDTYLDSYTNGFSDEDKEEYRNLLKE